MYQRHNCLLTTWIFLSSSYSRRWGVGGDNAFILFRAHCDKITSNNRDRWLVRMKVKENLVSNMGTLRLKKRKCPFFGKGICAICSLLFICMSHLWCCDTLGEKMCPQLSSVKIVICRYRRKRDLIWNVTVVSFINFVWRLIIQERVLDKISQSFFSNMWSEKTRWTCDFDHVRKLRTLVTSWSATLSVNEKFTQALP